MRRSVLTIGLVCCGLLLGAVLIAGGGLADDTETTTPPDLSWIPGPGQYVFGSPLPSGFSRARKLTFGRYVTPDPDTNPIDPPERFIGYHTALDLEILPGEEDTDVPVFAVCDGEVLLSQYAEGYGGMIVHGCTLKGADVTVLYGHLDTTSFTVRPGDAVTKGQQIAVLAPAKSTDSGDTRKHLHIGIHRGKNPQLLGYVQTEAELQGFIDPVTVLRLGWLW